MTRVTQIGAHEATCDTRICVIRVICG